MKNYILLAACLVLAWPSHAHSSEEYAFILKSRGNPYWTAVVDGIQETAKAHNVQAIIHQLENDRAAEEQLNTCMSVIERKPKLLALSAVTPAVGLQCLKKAAADGIAVADMDANISVADAKAEGIFLAYSVGSDNFLIGEKAAQYVKEITSSAKLKVFVLEGAAGSIPGQKRADGFRAMLKKLIPAVNITSLSAEWDRLKALNATTDLLQRMPDVGVIYAANDMMALGAAEAVRSVGKMEQIKVIGVDGIADARKAVQEGRLTASVAQLPYLIGKRAVELGIEAVKTGKTGVTEITATPVLDKPMLEAKKDPLLQYVR
ncbi:MAG: substrate-binding domain-containing protein [Alphaproteobacteria bacterium]|nr:substrate-binding domain-containing protein [Alphaproteobacteria bacterium]